MVLQRGHEPHAVFLTFLRSPDMSDVQRKVPKPHTRHTDARIKKGGPKVAAIPARRTYKLEWQPRNRALIKAAEERLKAHHAVLCEALVGNRPSGQFMVYQLPTDKYVLGRPKPQPNDNTLLLQLVA